MWRVGKLVYRHPGGAGRNAWVARNEVLMEVIDAKADNCEVNAFNALGAKRTS